MATLLPLHAMTIRPPGTSITFFGPTDAVGLGSGAGEVEPGGGPEVELLGSGEVGGLFDGETLGWPGLDDAGCPLEAGLVRGGLETVWLPSVRALGVGDGFTLGAPDDGVGLTEPGVSVLLVASDDDAAAAEF